MFVRSSAGDMRRKQCCTIDHLPRAMVEAQLAGRDKSVHRSPSLHRFARTDMRELSDRHASHNFHALDRTSNILIFDLMPGACSTCLPCICASRVQL